MLLAPESKPIAFQLLDASPPISRYHPPKQDLTTKGENYNPHLLKLFFKKEMKMSILQKIGL